MISVLYITRNEESCIEESIKSLADLSPDEIIVVDTGSVDSTTHLIRKFPQVKVFSYNWVDDFSKVRNYGLKHCSQPWVLVLDADERLDKHGCNRLRNAMASAPANVGGISIRFLDYVVKQDWINGDNPLNPAFPSPQIRAFRREKRVMFEGRAQESIANSIRKAGLGINLVDATIHHFLWKGRGVDYGQAKINYYKSLGSKISINLVNSPAAVAASTARAMARNAFTPSIQTEEVQGAPKLVPIVVCGYNAAFATKECINTIKTNTSIAYDLITVNNGSKDDTSNVMRQANGREAITFPRNVGVARGRNAGARQAMSHIDCDYICFLDNDTRVSPGWLESMVHVLKSRPNVGAVGPVTNNCDGIQNVKSEYNKDRFEDVHGLVKSRNNDFLECERIEGFCMLVRTEALKKTGLFEESFGLYGCEAYDLCLRLADAGYSVGVANQVYVEHMRSTTLRSNKINWHQVKHGAIQAYKIKWKGRGALNAPPMSGPVTHIKVERERSIPYWKQNPKTSIVILTCNRLDVTKRCIEALMANTSNYELIMIDNGSNDGTPEWLESKGLKVHRNATNLGVVIARNQGLKLATSEYIVMMDNDVFVTKGWLEELFDKLGNGNDIVGIEAWQIDHSFQACHKCVNKNERIDYLGGACNLYKRRVFETIGLLDEGFSPAYYEDVDICIRATKRGFKLGWFTSPRIKHEEHATLIHGQRDFVYHEALAKSHTRFASKMKGQLQVEHEKLPPLNPRLRILYLGMQWDYGVPERGFSFEHDNFYPSVQQWSQTGDMRHFDFVALGKQHGIAKMSEMLLEEVHNFRPDALFMVPFDENHDPRREVIKQISGTTPCKTIGWFCDSHFRYDNFDSKWAPYLDFCTTTSTGAMEKYKRDGFGNKVIKTQWGASPKYRKIENTPLDVDVSFVGQPHGDRRQVIDKLRSMGINVQVYGTGWPKRLSFDEMVGMFNRSKINLNLNNACDMTSKQIKGRNFEVPSCGGFLLTGTAENLANYYEYNREIAIYSSTEEMVEKIRYYLANEGERQAIADAGYQRTMNEHTYEARFTEIFSKAGLLKGR